MTRPDTEQHRQQILGQLRIASSPLTTDDVVQAVGPVICYWRHSDVWHRHGFATWRFLSCNGTHCIVMASLFSGNRAYQILVALQRTGTVRSIRTPGRRATLWVLTNSRVDRELTSLEDLYAAADSTETTS